MAELKREFGLLTATLIGIGATVGAGVFILLGLAIGKVGWGIVPTIGLTAVLTLFTALSYMELSEMLPFSGGGYFFIKQAFKGVTPFLAGWFSWFGNMAYGALAALTAGITLNLFVPFIPPVVFALFLLLAFVALNVFSSKETGKFEVVLSLFLLAGLVMFIFSALSHDGLLNTANIFESDAFGMLVTMSLIYPMFIGFEVIAVISEEIKDPHRNIHRAIMYTLVSTSVLYVLIAIAALSVLPAELLGSSYVPLSDVMKAVMGSSTGPFLISILTLVATLTTLNATVIASSRVCFALARDHYLPSSLNHISFLFRTPSRAVGLSGLIMGVLMLFGFVEFLGLAASFGFLFLLVFVNLAMLRLRKRKDIQRYFIAPWFPWTPIIGAVSSLLILLTIESSNLVFGIFLVVVALVVYEFEAGVRARMKRQVAPWEKAPKEVLLEKPREPLKKSQSKK